MNEIAARMKVISDEIGENIYEGVTKAKEKGEEFQEKLEDVQENFQEKREDAHENFQEKLEASKENFQYNIQKKKEEAAELRKKYNSDNLFANKKTNIKTEVAENTVSMIQYKETFFTKIKNWIRKIFNR